MSTSLILERGEACAGMSTMPVPATDGPANEKRVIAPGEQQSRGVLGTVGRGPEANDRTESSKSELCAALRPLAAAPEQLSVEVEDSAPIAGRLGPVPMAGTACGIAIAHARDGEGWPYLFTWASARNSPARKCAVRHPPRQRSSEFGERFQPKRVSDTSACYYR